MIAAGYMRVRGGHKLMRKILAAALIAALLIGAAWLHHHARYGSCTITPEGKVCKLIGY